MIKLEEKITFNGPQEFGVCGYVKPVDEAKKWKPIKKKICMQELPNEKDKLHVLEVYNAGSSKLLHIGKCNVLEISQNNKEEADSITILTEDDEEWEFVIDPKTEVIKY